LSNKRSLKISIPKTKTYLQP